VHTPPRLIAAAVRAVSDGRWAQSGSRDTGLAAVSGSDPAPPKREQQNVQFFRFAYVLLVTWNAGTPLGSGCNAGSKLLRHERCLIVNVQQHCLRVSYDPKTLGRLEKMYRQIQLLAAYAQPATRYLIWWHRTAPALHAVFIFCNSVILHL
jgi:hypothetical protein